MSAPSALGPPSPGGDGLRRGFFINLLGRSAVVASSAAVTLILARHYGAESFGRWSIATAYATLVGTLLDGGFHRLMMRDLGRTPEAAKNVLWRVLKRRLQIGAATVPLALCVAAIAVSRVDTWILIALLVATRLVSDLVGTFSSVLFAFERFRIPNAVEILRRSSLLGVVIVIVVQGGSMEWVGAAMLALTVAGSTAVIRPTLALVAEKTAPIPVSHWGDAAWFWVNGVLFWINAEVDQLMIAWLSDDRTTGLYAAAVRLIAVCLIIPKTVNDTVIRRWFRAGNKPDSQMVTTTQLLAGTGGILGLQFLIFSNEIIAFAYDSHYADASPAFAVLGLFLILHFGRCAPHWFLSTSDRVPLATTFLAAAAVVNFVTNLWLIPAYGALGAAYSTVACELLLVFLAYLATGKRAPELIIAAANGLIPALAAAAAALSLRLIAPWYIAAAAGGLLGAIGLGVSARRLLVSARS